MTLSSTLQLLLQFPVELVSPGCYSVPSYGFVPSVDGKSCRRRPDRCGQWWVRSRRGLPRRFPA